MTSSNFEANIRNSSIYQAPQSQEITHEELVAAKVTPSGFIRLPNGQGYAVAQKDGNIPQTTLGKVSLAEIALTILTQKEENFDVQGLKERLSEHNIVLIDTGFKYSPFPKEPEVNQSDTIRRKATSEDAYEDEHIESFGDEERYATDDGQYSHTLGRNESDNWMYSRTIRKSDSDKDGIEPISEKNSKKKKPIEEFSKEDKAIYDKLTGRNSKIQKKQRKSELADYNLSDYVKQTQTDKTPLLENAHDTNQAAVKIFDSPHITAQPRTEIQHLLAKRLGAAAIVVLASPILLPALAITASVSGGIQLYLKAKDFFQANSLLANKNDVKKHEKNAKLNYLEAAGKKLTPESEQLRKEDLRESILTRYGNAAQKNDTAQLILSDVFEAAYELAFNGTSNTDEFLITINKTLVSLTDGKDLKISPQEWKSMLAKANAGKLTELSSLVTFENIEGRFIDTTPLAQKKVAHHTLNYLARQGVDIDAKYLNKDGTLGLSTKEIVMNQSLGYTHGNDEVVNLTFFSNLNTALLENGISITITPEALGTILKEVNLEMPIRKDTAEIFRRKLDQFQMVLNDTSLEAKDKNKAIIQAYREVLGTEAYKAMMRNSSNPLINFLHSYAAGMYNEVKVMDVYKAFGEAVIDRDPELQHELKDLAQDGIIESKGDKKAFGEVLDQGIGISLKTLSKRLFTDHGLMAKVAYAIVHPNQALGSMASEGGKLREFSAIFGTKEYDPHGKLTNVPSRQGQTEATFNGESAKINNVYGGTPTMSDTEVTPEYLAVLQAAENNRLAPAGERVEGVPDRVLYTNFQNIENSHGEGKRSATIMLLNQMFPLAFQGITLAKDSKFYRMLDGVNTWQGTTASTTPLTAAQVMGNEMKNILMDKRNFSLEGRSGTVDGPGCYFPGGKQRWEGIFDSVISSTNEVFKDKTTMSLEEAVKTTMSLGDALNAFRAPGEALIEIPDSYELYKMSEEDAARLTEGQRNQLIMENCNPARLKQALGLIDAQAKELRGAYQEYVYASIQDYIEMDAAFQLVKSGVKDPLVQAQRACKENIDRGGAANAAYLYLRLDDSDPNKANLVLGALHCRALGARDRMILEARLPQIRALIKHVDSATFREKQAIMFSKIKASEGTPLTEYESAFKVSGSSTPVPTR